MTYFKIQGQIQPHHDDKMDLSNLQKKKDLTTKLMIYFKIQGQI